MTSIDAPRRRLIHEPLLWFAASALCFIASLALPCFTTDRPGEAPSGLALLLSGWLGLLELVPTWYANPLLFLAWVLLYSKRLRPASLVAAGAALGIALTFLLETKVTMSGVGSSRITGYGPGYWLWTASMAAVIAGNVVWLRARRPA